MKEPGTADRTNFVAVRAAQYMCKYTERQKYPTENQAEIISLCAAQRGFEIVRTYAEEGKSGLRLDARDSLKQQSAT